MIIDGNAYLGHWPFRRLRYRSACEVVELMDDKGIDMAVVSSINSIFYKNSHQGNKEIIEEIEECSERFIPLAVINPRYPGWERDLEECRDKLGMKGLRLFPRYHGYELDDSESVELVTRASEFGWPVFIPQRVVDPRQRHWFDVEEIVKFFEIKELREECPDVNLVIQEAAVPKNILDDSEDEKEGTGEIFFEISRIGVLRAGILKKAKEKAIEKLIFGTGLPFKCPEPVFVKLPFMDLDESQREKLLANNIAELLNLDID